MTADVQGWVDNPASNHGWILIGNESGPFTAKRFESRENGILALRPKVTVHYTPPAVASSEDIPLPAWALAALGALLIAGHRKSRDNARVLSGPRAGHMRV
jgi:MYXO-CTERM domain-containing protein